MKNKKLIAIVAAICVVILIEIIVIGQITRKTDHAGLANESITAGSKEATGAPEPAADTGIDVIEPTTDESPEGTEDKSEENVPESGVLEETQTASESYPIVPEIQAETDDDPEDGVLTFPYAIPNTGLTIQNIASYDGVFLEDGSDSSVSGIYSIVLKNTGSTNVEFARITLSCNGTPITFELSDLPSGAAVVVQETNQTAYQNGEYRDCNVDMAEIDALEQSAEQISVQENEDGSLTVSNLTDSLIPCVRIFYKFYMSDEDVYVGGITYTAKLTDLEAGGSQTIIPSHYSRGYSKVVMIRTYDSQE